MNELHEQAQRFHAERTVAAPSDPAVWYDYGAYCLRRGAPLSGKAEECLREAVSLDAGHLPSLLALAGVMTATGQWEKALTYAAAAKDAAPESALAWALLGVVSRALPGGARAADAPNCEYEARRLARGALDSAPADYFNDVYLHLTLLLLDLHLPELAADALALVERPASVDAQLCASRVASLRADWKAALAALRAAEVEDTAGGKPPTSSAVFALQGAVHLAAGDAAAATAAYERAIELSAGPSPLDVYLKLGSIYAAAGAHEDAKRTYLAACLGHARASAWLGAGVACMRLGDLAGAEEALAEANVLDNTNPAVWGTLALVSLLAGREPEAAAAMSQALKAGFADAGVFGELGAKYLELGRFRHAEAALRHAVAAGDASAYRRQLGDALREQGEDEEAAVQYKIAEEIDAQEPLRRRQAEEAAAAQKLREEAQVVFVLGGPGSGKGTQCERIVRDFGFTHLSAGDLLRAEVASGSELGQECEALMKEGKLVPMKITIELLRNAMLRAPNKQFLVDGFPRALDQAEFFEESVVAAKFVLFFDCPLETMQERLLKRGETSGRSDDNIDTIKKRFDTFTNQSLPVIEHYEKLGKVHRFIATDTPDEIYAKVHAILEADRQQAAAA